MVLRTILVSMVSVALLSMVACSSSDNNSGGPGGNTPQGGDPTPTPDPGVDPGVDPTPTPDPGGGPNPTPPPSDPAASVGTFTPLHDMTSSERLAIFKTGDGGCKKAGEFDGFPSVDPRMERGMKTYEEILMAEDGANLFRTRYSSEVMNRSAKDFEILEILRLTEGAGGFTPGQKGTKYCYVDKDECYNPFSVSFSIRYVFQANPLVGAQERWQVGDYTMPDGRTVKAWRHTKNETGWYVDAGSGGGGGGTMHTSGLGTPGKQTFVEIYSPDLVSFGLDHCGGGSLLSDMRIFTQEEVEIQRIFFSRLTDNPL